MTTFRSADLDAFERLLGQASAVVPMEDVADGLADETMIGMRHDCDNEIESAVRMADWEAERGYRSTYYILHSAPYFDDKRLLDASLEQIAASGHALGIHNDALTVALETGRDPGDVLYEAIEELRGYGHTIRSTVAHGNHLCHIAKYVNDEMQIGCARPEYGAADRVLEHNGVRVPLKPVPLSDFGLDFDANWLSRGDYLSDSGGQWSQPLDAVAEAFPSRGQLHLLQHPCWWNEALEPTQVAA